MTNNHPYVIRRKGSFYNITGPEGRLFRKYQSARVVGPRWEELTHTPWPYPSSAYEPGLRLWQMGLINREQIGRGKAETIHPVINRPAPKTQPTDTPPILLSQPLLALPAPRIDLKEQARLMQALRRDPKLIFMPVIRQALRREVEYHLPLARWASHLLNLLEIYDRRQRGRTPVVSQRTVTARHVAWQEQQFATV